MSATVELRHTKPGTIEKAESNGRGRIEMLASMSIVDRQDETILEEAWRADVREFEPGTIPVLVDHDVNREAGSLVDLVLDRRGLFAVAQLDLKSDVGRDTYEALLRATTEDYPGVSVGFETLAAEKDSQGRKVITRARLREVSILLALHPAVPTARVLNVKGGRDDDAVLRERLDRLEREHGITRKAKTPTDAELRARLDRLEAGSRSDDDIRRELERVERLVGLGHNGDGLGGRDGISSPDGVTVLG